MFFTRTQNFHLSVPKEDLKNRLIGKHVQIHDLDFEVLENEDQNLSIVPHDEQVNAIKTLPITQVDLRDEGGKTKVVVKSEMRKGDIGGSQLVIIFCLFLFIASALLFYVGGEFILSCAMLGVGLLVFTLFCVRMQTGYFDYVRKIHSYIRSKAQDPAMPYLQA